MFDKNKQEAGADSRTPSVPQYFAWINSINDGSSEAQTMINLDFFAWLKETYGMEIKIYAWDAGNFDGAGGGYGDENSDRFRTRYPRGYGPVAAKAAEHGIRLGLWGGPDGFGDTEEEEKKRYDFIVKLCRDYNFALFKLDGVCGGLRPEKADVFAKMLQECRKYCPDLIVLNHRLNLYGAEPYVTTFLWQGVETYVDVLSHNRNTGMHHRCFMFDRGLPDGLLRLAEDHGVCISSAVDYFEDDLIYQAFGRCMILAPEIYGNPWLMRDDEYRKLARVYNLHRQVAPILVDGTVLPASYGCNAVSRGTPTHRFLTTGNNSWQERKVTLRLGEECGIAAAGKVMLIQRHPTEKRIGIFDAGDAVEVTLMPFRAHLFEIAVPEEACPVLTDCEYEMIRETADGTPAEVKYLTAPGGTVHLWKNGAQSVFGEAPAVSCAQPAPRYITTMSPDPAALPRGEELYECALFGIDNDALEARQRRRSGESAIPQVRAARDAFFSQETYIRRGCESAFAFDGKPDTYFDAYSRFYCGSLRVDGGCLRLDLGAVYDADTVEITCFAIDEPIMEVPAQIIPERGDYAVDFAHWTPTGDADVSVADPACTAPVVQFKIHFMKDVAGKKLCVSYPVGKLRYFRLPCPMDRIYSVKVLKNGKEIPLVSPTLNNLQAAYGTKQIAAVQSCEITLPDTLTDGQYLAVAVEGEHGVEGAYCAAEMNGQLLAFPDRAPSYPSNVWEHLVVRADKNYTYYLPLTASMAGQRIKLFTLFCNPDKTDLRCDVYLCPKH